ncbi:PAS domain S-box protein (plasmid) [Aneurinibacillus sp. Ricciae_BoGa-3]|uniref:PAS domain-containing protein n=1 Tax=Aneurinibacillus sp. Ricciae_BoGa-3 TaxID=3022697 RepID=UPI00234006F9|nr:PAS domain S-box protein [Aneurinibacillus sp. Ricciae_BoGa-3]WCK57151.1 PAS domain S-box protein [Aneurinibacillus sp. Ricciae_BoGa-3]
MEKLSNHSSIEIYKSIMQYNPDALFILSVNGKFMEVNEAVTKIFGYTLEEVKEIHYQDILVPEQLDVNHQHFQQALQGFPCEYETEIFHKDGDHVHLQVKIVPLVENNRIIGIFGVAKDKKELHQTKASLMKNEEGYGQLVELSPEPIMIHHQGRIQYANPACTKLIGASTLEELMGQSILDYFHPDSVELIKNRINQTEKIGENVTPIEEKLIRLDGTVVDVEVSGIIINHQGKPAFLMIYHDISRRKRAEEALRQSEQNYRLIAENMTDLVCVIDWDGFFKYASPSHFTVLGFSSV